MKIIFFTAETLPGQKTPRTRRPQRKTNRKGEHEIIFCTAPAKQHVGQEGAKKENLK